MRAAFWVGAFVARWLLNIGAVMLIVKAPPLLWYLPAAPTFAVAAIVGGFSALIARPFGRASPLVLLLNGWMFWWATWSGQFNPLLSWVRGDLVHGYLIANGTAAFLAATVYAAATLVTSAIGTNPRRAAVVESEPSSPISEP